MKFLQTVLLLATVTTAQAQSSWPATGTWTDTKGNTLGTVTHSGNRLYMRNTKNELVATVIFDPDGTRTIYDPNGKVLDQIKASGDNPSPSIPR